MEKLIDMRFILAARVTILAAVTIVAPYQVSGEDYLRNLQSTAVQNNHSEAAHWGYDPEKYTLWGSHSNRLIPVYTFGTCGTLGGVNLESYTGKNSPYRNEEAVRRIFGYLPDRTIAETADYLDQTNIYSLQRAAAASGKKHIFLVIFDGMDWQTTQAAAIYNSRKVSYHSGRGSGTHFQEYTAKGTTQFGFMVTSPHNEGTDVDVNKQQVLNVGGTIRGGYDPIRGGHTPWSPGNDPQYLIGLPRDAEFNHAYTDSSCSASSMAAGIKSYNGAVNVDPFGRPVRTIAHELQSQGWAVGIVTSVPFSHATPAAAYAQNVDRDDYQDLSRDLLGLPSITHSPQPLPGMDVVIGCGYGVEIQSDMQQGTNFVAGNKYLTQEDLHTIDVGNGGKYVVAQRTAGISGAAGMLIAAAHAVCDGQRLFAFYGVPDGNLPFQTADGDFQPAPGRTGRAVAYTQEDIAENPTLAEMTAAAISVVEHDPQGFWLMVEAGDVDWGNHDNNLDTSIGAVNSGDAAVKVITDWVECASNWQDALVIVTADHGHYLVLDNPELLIPVGDQ